MDGKGKRCILHFLVSEPSSSRSSLILDRGFAFLLFGVASRVGRNGFLCSVFKRGVTGNRGFGGDGAVSRKGTSWSLLAQRSASLKARECAWSAQVEKDVFQVFLSLGLECELFGLDNNFSRVLPNVEVWQAQCCTFAGLLSNGISIGQEVVLALRAWTSDAREGLSLAES
jgi:hypothetical protein